MIEQRFQTAPKNDFNKDKVVCGIQSNETGPKKKSNEDFLKNRLKRRLPDSIRTTYIQQ